MYINILRSNSLLYRKKKQYIIEMIETGRTITAKSDHSGKARVRSVMKLVFCHSYVSWLCEPDMLLIAL